MSDDDAETAAEEVVLKVIVYFWIIKKWGSDQGV